jgi:hypothetical protein
VVRVSGTVPLQRAQHAYLAEIVGVLEPTVTVAAVAVTPVISTVLELLSELFATLMEEERHTICCSIARTVWYFLVQV